MKQFRSLNLLLDLNGFKTKKPAGILPQALFDLNKLLRERRLNALEIFRYKLLTYRMPSAKV